MHQLHIGRQQIFEAEPVNGVSVAAAHFHKSVVPRGIGEAPNLIGCSGD
jgi:hypothetical protein